MKKLFRGVGMIGALLLCASILFARYGNPALGKTDEERNAVYLDVYNSDDVAHENGDVVVYKDGTYDGLEISTTGSAANPLVAGVVADPRSSIPASSWGRIQVMGYNPAITIAVANSAGDPLVTSTTGEAADVHTLATSTTTVGSDAAVFAIALEATTASTTVKGILLGR